VVRDRVANIRQRLILIATLYVSQAIPLGFFIVALPAIARREGLSLEKVGLLGALAFPWLIKFLWAPLVDRRGSRRFGHYRSWIVPLQMLSLLAVLATAVVDISVSLVGLAIAGAIFMVCSATQDVATDGLAVRIVNPDERGPANGIQVGGYYLGQILGGGGVLLVFSRFGWTTAIVAMAVFVAIPLIPALRFREPPSGVETADRARIGLRTLAEFVRRPGAGTWILILLLYRTGAEVALRMGTAMLVDRDMTLDQIGLLIGVVGSVAALAGAMAGGLLMGRVGRRSALALFGLLHAVALGGWLIPAGGLVTPFVVCSVTSAAMFTGGMATAALYTNMMDRSDPRTAATDFTLQQSLCAFGPILGAVVSGFVADAFGYGVLFTGCVGLTALTVVIVLRWLTADACAVSCPAS
jgi:RhtX/FptX family siderophore transporter